MATLTWNPGINSSNPYIILTVTEQSQSTSGNYSILAYDLKLYRPYSISSSSSKSYNVKINGITVKSGSTTIGGSGTKTIASGTTTVYHNSDGTKSNVAISFYQAISITWSGSNTGDASKSGTMNLTTIPRASTPTLSSSTTAMGSSVTIYTNRASSAFTHNLTYVFGGASGTVATGVGTSYAWSIPKSLANQIPSDTTGTGSITCKTYNGGTLIGTKTITFKASVPDTTEFKPSIGTISVSEAVSGLNTQFGAYLKSKSKLSISYTTSGAYGSSVNTKKIVANGATYNSSSATTGYLTSSGTLTITATVTDSRGRTVSKSTNITVLDYNSPSISKLNVFRTNADGTENDEGEFAKVEVTGSVTSLNSKNTKSFKIKYKKSIDVTYTVITLDNSLYSIDTSEILSNIDANSTYDIVFEVNDYFTSTPKTEPLSTAFTLVDYHKDGKSVAFGKVADGSVLVDVGGDINVDGVINSGEGIITSSGIGTTQHISVVGGGQYTISSVGKVGAIKITLPFSWNNTMLSFWVDVYEYSQNTSFSVLVGGYAYAGGGGYWNNTTATIVGTNNVKTNHPIRFGYDGSKCCIYIGEINYSWSYPKVNVRDVNFGHSSTNFNLCKTGWNVDIVTSFVTVNKVHITNEKTYPSLLNGWENYGSPYEMACYYKDTNGIVHLEGLIRRGSVGYVAFMLPDGHKPKGHMIFANYSNNYILARVDVYEGGEVMIKAGDTGYLSLSGISFLADN